MTKTEKIKVRRMTRSFSIPINLIDEIEEISKSIKGMNVNKAANEGLQLWLKQNRKKETVK